jgi:uncharacterized protein (TIGR02217 family)
MASLTVLSDVVMPERLLSAGVRGKNIRRNTRTQARNGRVQINVDADLTQRQYEFGSVPLTLPQWQDLEGLHEVTDGGAFGLLLPDPKDASASITQGIATLITGTTYQLHKRYTSAGSSRTKDRKITRPRAAGFVIQVSGTPLVSGSGYTLNADTGVVTIPSAPAANTITWSGAFYVPVHFLADELDWDIVRGGPYDGRFVVGPNVVLIEVIE